ncbi:hypothetical protein BD779DRAFT_1542111 [Infundibulicybe gibba]|nr:hypothetical protein BD779DRAFT_1542111 [Infundibulicybe gibba]
MQMAVYQRPVFGMAFILVTINTDSLADTSSPISPGQLEDIFYGFFVSTILFGICVTQAWTYINTNRDTWVIRVWVMALL